jgi:rsbT co-antagonist protein RsbR
MTENQLVGMNLIELYGDTGEGDMLRDAMAGRLRHSSPGGGVDAHGFMWENWYVPADEAASGAAAILISLNVSEARRREDELRAKIDLVEKQRETIRELSTPIIEVWDGVLTLPIVGLVDSVRTAELMDNLLQTVSRTRSRFAILDLTGVQVVDTSTASHLIGLIQAIRLLGAEGVLTGIHPNIAQTIVAIGVDLARVRVFATLRDALKHCIEQMTRRG